MPTDAAVTALGEGLRFLSTFSIDTGELTRWYPDGFDRMVCFAYSADERFLTVGYGSGVTRAYRISETVPVAELVLGLGESEERDQRLSIHALVFAPTADPMQQWLAVAGGEFWLWNAVTQQFFVAPDPDSYTAVAFAPSVDAVFVGHRHFVSKYTIRPFHEEWRAELFPAPMVGVGAAALSPDGGFVVVTQDDLTCSLLSAFTGELVGRFYFSARPNSIAFVPNSRLLAVADGSPTLRVYDADIGTVARAYDWGIGGIHCVTFSNDGAMAAAGGDKGRIVVWDAE